MAWITAALSQAGKKFPKSPEEIWTKQEGPRGEGNLLAAAKAMKSSQDKQKRLDELLARRAARLKQKKKKGKDMVAPVGVTILRPE